ncbi:MAG: 23S rRNA (guanosine(2251)-2'-O)-methyltransferase RlmB, partial [Oscillospiraceae bacterium]|nr:23S rRNA (guanosine(2251)-2'-O)-methyltransferase RlmB [Oscillospiraceae bacterium]
MNNTRDDNTFVFGKNAALELLKSERPVDTLFLSAELEKKQAAFYAALVKDRGAVIKHVHPAKLDELCGGKPHQGVAVV